MKTRTTWQDITPQLQLHEDTYNMAGDNITATATAT